MNLCAAEFIDTDTAFEVMFNFRETGVFMSHLNADGEEMSAYANAGYDSSIFFVLLGPIFFLLILDTCLKLIKKLLQTMTARLKENCITRALRRKTQYLLFSMRFLLESCLEIGLSAMICVLMIEGETFAYTWEAVSTILAIISLVGLLIAPFAFCRFTRRYYSKVKKAKEDSGGELDVVIAQMENGDLLEPYRFNLMAYNYQVIFFLRRYLMLGILTLAPYNELL